MPVPPPSVGLCEACRHARRIVSGRGSSFTLCERSRIDPRFPRYPQLPVLECSGFEPARPADLDARGPET
ncbi:MAG: hypothetical protein H0V73_01565 [Chloroflexi bacterium]|nr:hypothetical protein [Chloroflexota bacterium]